MTCCRLHLADAVRAKPDNFLRCLPTFRAHPPLAKDHRLFIRMRSPSTPSSGHQHPHPPTRSVSVHVTLRTVLILLGLVWLLFSTVFHVDSVPRTVGDQTPLPTTAVSAALLKRCLQLVSKEERHSQASAWDLDLNYVSKRRVPNGPNPIHNRRAVKYRQPPGA